MEVWRWAPGRRVEKRPSGVDATASSKGVPAPVGSASHAITRPSRGSRGGATPDEQQRFETGLVDLMRRQQLYFEKPDGVEITGGVLYRARINIPARVPVGNYTAETFLIQDGRVITAAGRAIRIEKLGFARVLAEADGRWSLPYTLVARL